MRVSTKVVIDIETLRVEARECSDWNGSIALCKGSDVANSQRKDELALQQQAFDLQKQAFSSQQDIINGLKQNLAPYLTAQGQGFTPQQNAQLTSQFLNNNSSQFNQAGQSVRQALGARGGGLGDSPISGDYVRGLEGLMGAGASSQAAGLQNLGIANANQALANKFNSANLLTGNAATLNGAQGAASGSFGSAGSAASSALQSYITAANSGFLSSFTKALGGGLGGGLASAATGGLGTVASGIGSGNFGW